MRELKYKFWDREEKRMIGPNLDSERYYIGSYNGLALFDTERKDEDGYTYQMDVEFLQYTGLKDHNGKEIYEGYIVRLESPTDYFGIQPYGMPVKNGHGELFVIIKLNCGFVLRHISFFESRDLPGWDAPNWVHKGWKIIDNYTFWNEQRLFRVVGNIYEDPSLLEDTP